MRILALTLSSSILMFGSSARAADAFDLRIGIEGQTTRIQDVAPIQKLGGFLSDTRGPVLDPGLPSPALRLKASLGRRGSPGRFELAVTHLSADEGSTATGPTLGVPSATVSYGVGAKWTAIDALWSRRIAGSEPSLLRVQLGYRYASAERRAAFAATYPNMPGCCQYAQSQLFSDTGHGLRIGLEGAVRLVGPLSLEAEGGLGLLRASRGGEESLTYREFIDDRQVVPFEGGHGLATIDLAARLAASWGPVTASVGYRFDSREETLPASSVHSLVYANLPLPQARPLRFGGVTGGLTLRIGR